MKNNILKIFSGTALVLMMILVALACCNMMGYVQIAAAETGNMNDVASEPLKYYTGTTAMASVTETVNFTRYTVTEGNANPFCPQYYNLDSGTYPNACAPIGGSIVVGYYDRYCTDLIPNVTPGFMLNGNYRYFPMASNATAIQSVIVSLYNSMGTNSLMPGTTRTQYQTGLSTYVTNAGYNISFTSVMSGGSLDVNGIISQLTSGKVVTLYIANPNLCSVTFGSTSATYTIYPYTGNHIEIAYKYKLIKYYDTINSNYRTDILLGVSTGMYEEKSGWYYVGYSATNLDHADATYIY